MAGVYHKAARGRERAQPQALFGTSCYYVRLPMETRLLIVLPVLAAGCFYPPEQPPPPASLTRAVVDIPYDLTWDAVQKVVADNNYRVITSNPDAGILEAQQIGGFTLADADCGKLRGIGAKIAAEPDPNASVVYDFHVDAKSEHASEISVEATFTAPLHIPLHQVGGEQCVSRGVQEARLLDEIKRQALLERRTPVHVDLRKNS